MADPNSYAARLEELLNRPEVLREIYLAQIGEKDVAVTAGWLANVNDEERGEADLTEEQTRKLWKAFLEDLEGGRIHRYLLDGRERRENCYYTDVDFTLTLTAYQPNGERESYTNHLSVTLQNSASAMMKVLQEEELSGLLRSRDLEKYPDTQQGY